MTLDYTIKFGKERTIHYRDQNGFLRFVLDMGEQKNSFFLYKRPLLENNCTAQWDDCDITWVRLAYERAKLFIRAEGYLVEEEVGVF